MNKFSELSNINILLYKIVINKAKYCMISSHKNAAHVELSLRTQNVEADGGKKSR